MSTGGNGNKCCSCSDEQNCIHRVVVDVGGGSGARFFGAGGGNAAPMPASVSEPTVGIIDASEAQRLSIRNSKRLALEDTVRCRAAIIQEIDKAVKEGRSSVFINLMDFHKDAIANVTEEFKARGYTIIDDAGSYCYRHLGLDWSGDK